MATVKQLNFIKAICDELGLNKPGENITTREASRFISKNVTKFYIKKAQDKENSLSANRGNNYKSNSLFKSTDKTIRISSEQNVKNIKDALRHDFGYDIWTNEKH